MESNFGDSKVSSSRGRTYVGNNKGIKTVSLETAEIITLTATLTNQDAGLVIQNATDGNVLQYWTGSDWLILPIYVTKTIAGITPPIAGAESSFPHGLVSTKIITIQGVIEYNANEYVPFSYNDALFLCLLDYTATDIIVRTDPSNIATLNKPFKVLITHQL
jgi:hypothetical protein